MLLCASLAQFWGISHVCRCKWLTDSKAAISKVTFIIPPSNRPRQYPDNIDFDTAIHEVHQSLGGRKMRIKCVQGHQDDRIPDEELSSEAKLNIDIDALALDHNWSGSEKNITIIPHFPELKVSIVINGVGTQASSTSSSDITSMVHTSIYIYNTDMCINANIC
jgi:hypothetical protein